MDNLEKIRARFTALKTLSGLQAKLLTAFQEKNKADSLKYGDIGRAHGGATWAEIARVAEGKSVCCGGKAFTAIISYTGQTELGEKITACIKDLPGDAWRGMALFDLKTIDSLQIICEAFDRDGEELTVEEFSRIFPENMRQGVLGLLNRQRERASVFAEEAIQKELFAFLAGDGYEAALKKGFDDLAEERKHRGEVWKDLTEKLGKIYVGREAQAKALGVHSTTINNLLNGTTASDLHAALLKKAHELLAPAERPTDSNSPDLSVEQETVIACLFAAHKRDPVRYSFAAMSKRMSRSRRWLSRIVHREMSIPEDFVLLAKTSLDELFSTEQAAAAQASSIQKVEAPTEAKPETESRLNTSSSMPILMPEALAEATVSIGMSALKSGVRALEDWQVATDSQLQFSTKQRDDMARLAARLVRLSGLNPAEVSLAITGEPVTIEDLRGVFGAIDQEDRRRS